MVEFGTPNEIIPAPEGEGNTVYNAGVIMAVHEDVVGAWENERLNKYPWVNSLVNSLVQRISNLRALHKRAEAEGYAAGLEVAAGYLEKAAADAAADRASTGKIWPHEAAKAIRALGKEQKQ